MTVVFVTHSVFESVYLSQRVVVMSARPGRVFSELAIDAPARDAALPHLGGICRPLPALRPRRWRGRWQASREPRHERARAPHCAARPGARDRRAGLGPGGAPQRHSALHPAGAGAGAVDARRRLADPVGFAARHAGNDVRGSRARRDRRRRSRHRVQPVAADRALVLSLRGDPAGDAGGGDRAAAADLSAAAGGGAGLRLDRRVLSGARQHHARPELGRPQSRRPVPAVRRVALADAVAS